MRHTFQEFIDRYYMLSEGLTRSQLDSQGLKNAAVTIAKRLLGNTDWQVGKTKIFLKVKKEDTWFCMTVFSLLLLLFLLFYVLLVENVATAMGEMLNRVLCHGDISSRPQSPRSFWSAPSTETAGRIQHWNSAIHGLFVKSGKCVGLKIKNQCSIRQ